jgi:heme-degrading monooxygenase HmoA
MHARVTTIYGSPADADAGIENFRTNVVPFAHEQGGKGAILLVDRDRGEAVAITLWDDEQSLQATEESANALRAGAADDMGATGAPKVGRYEVAVFEV